MNEERTGIVVGRGLVAAARSDRGVVRDHNEDAFVCRPDLALFAAIDGMGGQKGGAIAAALVRDQILADKDPVKALQAANDRLCRLSMTNPDLRGIGCVASAVQVRGDKVSVAHVGDTRVYLASRDACEQLTRDHTLAARRQEEMGLTEGTSRALGGANRVTRDIGAQPQDGAEWIDRLEADLEDGDMLLLCSDGLHGVMKDGEIFERLRDARRAGTSPDALVQDLVQVSLERGAPDNVTVVVAQRLAGALRPTIASRIARVLLLAIAVGLGGSVGWCTSIAHPQPAAVAEPAAEAAPKAAEPPPAVPKAAPQDRPDRMTPPTESRPSFRRPSREPSGPLPLDPAHNIQIA